MSARPARLDDRRWVDESESLAVTERERREAADELRHLVQVAEQQSGECKSIEPHIGRRKDW